MIPSSLDRVRRLRRMLDERGLDACSIEVDGGINEETIAEIVAAGADVLVMGSAIFGVEGSIAGAMRRLKALL
jgi:ribulose-phosphate 3-epimerase